MAAVASAAEKGQEPSIVGRTPRLILWLFYAYIISGPFFGFSLANVAGRGLARPDWLAAGALLGAFFIGCIASRCQLRRSPANGLVVVFVVTGFLSAVNLFDAADAQFIDFGTKAAQLFLAAVFFLVISSLRFSERELRSSLRLWLSVALGISLVATYQALADVFDWPLADIQLTNPSVTQAGGAARMILGSRQVSGFLSEPSYLGAYLIGPVVLSSVFMLKGGGHLLYSRSHIVNWTILAVPSLALLLTGSQGAYLTLLVTVACMFASNRIERIGTIKLAMAFVVLFLLIGIILALFEVDFLGAVTYRSRYLVLNMVRPLETAEVTSFRVRSECILAALDVWTSHPLLGVGLNNLSNYTDVCEFAQGWAQLLVDQGLLGTIALVLVFWTLLRDLSRLSKNSRLSPFWSVVSLGLFFVLISDIVNGVFTCNWVDLQRWFTLGVANLVCIQANSGLSVSESSATSSTDIAVPGGFGRE